MNNIYLIGMPGCGKSTIGRILAADLGLIHIDADAYLEQKYNMKISDIFGTKGEDAFRQMETDVISELCRMDGVIISTGGGVVTRSQNKQPMKNSGTLVFIDSTPETLLKNSSLEGRPLLRDKSKVYDLYNSRIAMYRNFADIIADNNGFIEDTLKTIKKSLNLPERND